jgi:hypothetical protein
MNKIIISIIAIIFSVNSAFGQFSGNHLNGVVKTLKAGGKSDEDIKNTVNGIINNPELYNSLWKNYIEQSFNQDSTKWKLLKDFNIQFKNFQTTDNAITSLGFTYDFNYDYAKYTDDNNNRISNSFGLSANGNVAFKKQFNPVDFLETKVYYNYSHFIGGVVTQKDTAVFTELNNIRFELASLTDMHNEEAIELWGQLGKKMVMSNQYYYALSPKFTLESNQDFSKKQFTSGITIDLGAKAWNENNLLSYLNIFDYPFAVLRYIFGTDKKFTVYGSTIPTAQFTFDYILPSSDLTRNNLVGNLNPYPRIKFETGFRTFITRIKMESIFFNANYRYYQELKPPEVIKEANLNFNQYFVLALQSTSGFYLSYANGKLPFDEINDEIYSIGFNYKLN